MTTGRWLLLCLVLAIVLVGAGALGGYWVRSSSVVVFDAWRAAGDSLGKEGLAAQRAHDDSLMREVTARITQASQQATAGAQHDTAAAVTDVTIIALLDSLAHARDAADSLRTYPPIVSGQQREIGELRLASSSWRAAFDQERGAVGGLLARIASDSTFQQRVLAHLDSTPKPPRTSLVFAFLHPKPYVKGEWGAKTGFEAKGGLCVGACGN
jgi:uncharacterized membrane protein